MHFAIIFTDSLERKMLLQFISMREFTASPREAQKKLAEGNELIVTNNGTPTMLVIDITDRNFVKLIEYLRRQEALDILNKVQIASVRNGKAEMSVAEIDAEIAVYRQSKREQA